MSELSGIYLVVRPGGTDVSDKKKAREVIRKGKRDLLRDQALAIAQHNDSAYLYVIPWYPLVVGSGCTKLTTAGHVTHHLVNPPGRLPFTF